MNMDKFLVNFDHLGYCRHIDPIDDKTNISQLIRERQGLGADDDLDSAYGFWDIQNGPIEELENAAIVRNCYLDMQDGCECVCGCHDLPAY